VEHKHFFRVKILLKYFFAEQNQVTQFATCFIQSKFWTNVMSNEGMHVAQ
jgi:hypothetical protein